MGMDRDREFEVRPIGPDEFVTFSRTTETAFGGVSSDEEIEGERAVFEFDRSLAALDRGQIVGTTDALSLELTLPGPTVVPAAGVTWVGVLPTYRRRGVLRRLMQRQLADVRERGEKVAILSSSESSIYRRFGYGPATDIVQCEVDRAHATLLDPAPPAGRFRLLERDEAAQVLPAVFDRVRRHQPGQVSRNRAQWVLYLRDIERWRHGASARFYAAYEPADGRIEGYVAYRIEHKHDHDLPANTLQVMDLIAATPEAHRALWRYCLNVDLVATVRSYWSPPDEPLRWMLADPRRLRVVSRSDFLWVRLVDIPAALAARRYAAAGRVVFEVSDPFLSHNNGCYALEAGPDGAACHPTTAEPDLALDVAELGAAYLGGTRFSTLARAGLVDERRAGTLARADALFACDPPPWCSTEF